MAVATMPPSSPIARVKRRGFRPAFEGDVPSLGWGVLAWGHAYLPSPADERQALVLTDEQARRVLRFYELDPLTGDRVYRRLHMTEAKGWGKSPEAAFIAVAELRGPVCFDGWDADGQPVGVRWGTAARPAPWIQIAAVSEDQTENTYGALYSLLTANEHRAAIALGIDDGRTRLYLRDMPGARLEPVTASAGSREGQRLTFAVLDETHLWTKASGGHKLAQTILRNLAKMDGAAVVTSNAHVIGERSVTELTEAPEPGVLHYAIRPSEIPQADWPAERLRALLEEVYAECSWIDPDRILAEIADPAHPWEDSLRYWFNIPAEPVSRRWLSSALWDACAGSVSLDPKLALHVVVRASADHRSGAMAMAQRQGPKVVLRISHLGGGPDYLDLVELEKTLGELRAAYRARVRGLGRKPLAGPLVVMSGGFLEGTAQRLEREGASVLNVPDTAERRAKGAEAMRGLVERTALVHEDDPELARQLSYVVERHRRSSLSVEASELHDAPAIFAAMEAVRHAAGVGDAPERSRRLVTFG